MTVCLKDDSSLLLISAKIFLGTSQIEIVEVKISVEDHLQVVEVEEEVNNQDLILWEWCKVCFGVEEEVYQIKLTSWCWTLHSNQLWCLLVNNKCIQASHLAAEEDRQEADSEELEAEQALILSEGAAQQINKTKLKTND